MKILLIVITTLFIASGANASETEIPIGKFNSGDLTGWNVQTIGMMKAKTIYSITSNGNRRFLAAKSTKAASGLIYKVNLDAKEYHSIKWSWKIEHTNRKGDEKVKDGDDFPVRLYVVFNRGMFSSNRAICYVWANKLAKGKHLASPYSANIITVAADSGNELAGQWISHRSNIYEDYKRFFGEEPPKIGAIAIMTDSDNTGETSVGYYGDISLIHTTRIIEVKTKDIKNKESQHKDVKQKEQAVPAGTAAHPSAVLHHEPQKEELKNGSLDKNGKTIQAPVKPDVTVKKPTPNNIKQPAIPTDTSAPAPPKQ